MTTTKYDALLIVSFGGPEGMDDVMPFLENVLQGKNVPTERKLEVAHHYELFQGISPINEQNRQLIRALKPELEAHGLDIPIYWGNRNWRPFLSDTITQMAKDGIGQALAFFTSAYSSYSGCRQYRDDIKRAQQETGPSAPVIDKIRVFYNHPGFIEANSDYIRQVLYQVAPHRRDAAYLVFTAHSIPLAMADCSAYKFQFKDACKIVAEKLAWRNWRLAYQSRSGPLSQPWLKPDVSEVLVKLKETGIQDIILSPLGFISDHMEVLYDLDIEARELCDKIGLNLVRAHTAGTHPRFISMIRELVEERISDYSEKRYLGKYGPWHDVCPDRCCLAKRTV